MATKTTFQGKLDVSLSPDGLEADIHFQPGGDTGEAELSTLLRLLQAKNIREGVATKDLEGFLGRLKGAKAAFSQSAAKGTPPQEAVPETPAWEDLPIPPELEANGKKALEAAGEPLIYADKVENIKHEKIVLKKSRIPFAPPKKTKVVEIEKKVTKTKIAVDPAVTGTGYAAEGALIAQLQPFTPGKPGKSVTGALIPAKNPENPYVHAGKGVQKKSGKLIALWAGFLRHGKNWAEVIPFRAHEWKLSLSPDKSSCVLSLVPGDVAASVPTGETIRAAALALPYEESELLPAEDIYVLVRNLAAENKPAEIPINRPEDAAMEIRVAEDRLAASLFLKKGRGGGKALALREVGKLIQSSGLAGLNLKKIQADILAFYKSQNRTLENYALAKGRPPSAASAAEIRWEIKFMDAAALENLKKSMPPPAAKAENPGGETRKDPYAGLDSLAGFPPRAAEMAAFVAEGETLLSLKPGRPGASGTDVYGKPLTPAAGQEARIVCRENVEMAQNSAKALAAGIFEARKTGDGLEIRVRPHADARVEVGIAPDGMEAFITVVPAEGTGRALTPAAITEAVGKAGIVYKAQLQEVLEALKKKAAEGEGFSNLSFAKGKAAKHAASPKLNVLVAVQRDKVAIKGDGQADYKNSKQIPGVKKDQTVAEILPAPAAPEDGWDVRGKILAARAAGEQSISVGKNLRQEEKDGKTLLIAEANGELSFDERSIGITEGHVINGNVDMKTGNVKFPGTVIVSGFVDTGFFVMAGGDIKIAQGIGAALLSSEGSITIGQGIKGMGKAVLRSKKDIGAAFAEQALIMSVGNITLKNACVRCHVKCNGKLLLASEKGFLIGGKVKSRLGLEAASLGNESGVPTEISFGQDYLLADQAEGVEKMIQKLNVSCSKLNVLMREAEKSNDQRKRESCHTEKLKAMKQIEKLNHQLLTLRERFEEHFPGEITVRGTLYPGVVIESHGRYYEVKQPRTKLKLVFDQESGKIVEKQI
ncbi:MAG: FapA family protein [Spirochaetia bacterium]|jgi:uncharacterized protein (DUF342 family)|nr:FapA family protein [Spirochaetia bacterium]